MSLALASLVPVLRGKHGDIGAHRARMPHNDCQGRVCFTAIIPGPQPVEPESPAHDANKNHEVGVGILSRISTTLLGTLLTIHTHSHLTEPPPPNLMPRRWLFSQPTRRGDGFLSDCLSCMTGSSTAPLGNAQRPTQEALGAWTLSRIKVARTQRLISSSSLGAKVEDRLVRLGGSDKRSSRWRLVPVHRIPSGFRSLTARPGTTQRTPFALSELLCLSAGTADLRSSTGRNQTWHCITELVMVSFLGTTARFFSYRRICRNRIFLRGTRGGNCGEARGSTTALLILALGPWEMLSRAPIGYPAMTPDTERPFGPWVRWLADTASRRAGKLAGKPSPSSPQL